MKNEVYINDRLYLARKYVRIFDCGHSLFQDANSFPRAKLENFSENLSEEYDETKEFIIHGVII